MNNEYGNCNYCNAPRVKNPKTGKIFCSEKCWLKNDKPNGTNNIPVIREKPATGANFNRSSDFKNPFPQPQDPLKILADEISALREKVEEMINIRRQETGQ